MAHYPRIHQEYDIPSSMVLPPPLGGNIKIEGQSPPRNEILANLELNITQEHIVFTS